MKKQKFGILSGFKLTSKIYLFFTVLVFLIGTTSALNVTITLDFQDSYQEVEEYSLPSVIAASQLKDDVHIALLGVYSYVTTGDASGKDTFNNRFNNALLSQVDLFTLSQTSQDFFFVQSFNEQLNNLGSEVDTLIFTYENDASDEAIAVQLNRLTTLRDEFNEFVATEITTQAASQVSSTNQKIADNLRLIQYYILGVIVVIILIVAFIVNFIANDITKPLKQLTVAAERFSKGDFKPVQVRRNDELGLFAQTFNKMAKDIQTSQEALSEELEKTKQLDRQKSEFLSVAAHQLRTPMAGIRWVSQMLFDGDMGEMNKEQKHHLGNGLENIDRMIKLINDLLDVTKIEEQTFKYQFERINIVEMVKQLIKELEEQASAKKVKVSLSTSHPEIPVEADAEKIKIAFMNVIDNAIKYSPNGTVKITLTKKRSTLEATVQDSGIGIPESVQEEMFTKFFRAPNAMKVFADGSGLGLFMVKDIVEKHDGSIAFTSEQDKGTTFSVSVPRVHKVSAEEKAMRAAKEKADS